MHQPVAFSHYSCTFTISQIMFLPQTCIALSIPFRHWICVIWRASFLIFMCSSLDALKYGMTTSVHPSFHQALVCLCENCKNAAWISVKFDTCASIWAKVSEELKDGLSWSEWRFHCMFTMGGRLVAHFHEALSKQNWPTYGNLKIKICDGVLSVVLVHFYLR